MYLGFSTRTFLKFVNKEGMFLFFLLTKPRSESS